MGVGYSAVQGFPKLSPFHLFWPLLAFPVPWVTCYPVLATWLSQAAFHAAYQVLSFYWTVPAIPSLALHKSSVDSNIYYVFFYLFYQCKFPRPLPTTLLWLMMRFTVGWLRCASSALFLNICIHEQSCFFFSLNLLSVSPEENFKDWGWMPPCFMEAMTSGGFTLYGSLF